MSSDLQIRPFNAATDLESLSACVIAIQDFERELVPSMPSGLGISKAYIDDMMRKCHRYEGRIDVATVDEAVVGYVTLYLKMHSHEVEDGDAPYAQIGDLVLLAEFRGRGFGKRLMHHVEQLAREAGANALRIGVLCANTVAADLYQSLEFKPLAMQLEKTL